MNELKPCPFCGNEVNVEKIPLWYGNGRYEFKIKCENCGCTVHPPKNDSIYISEEKARENAIKTWNKRVDPSINVRDTISRKAAIDALRVAYWDKDIQSAKDDPAIVDAMTDWAIRQMRSLPSAQSETCEYYDAESHFCALNRPSAQPEQHTMEEFMYGQDIGNPEDGSL